MPPFRLPAYSLRSHGRLRAAAWTLLGALSLLAAACSQGTSSGVDNPSLIPSLTVSFTSAGAGAAARVTGSLNVYAADQNPAIDPEPLATIQVKNSAFTLLTGDDFRRAQQEAAKRGAAKDGTAKRAASIGATGSGDRTKFNLVFTTQDKHGGIALGLAYDSAARYFTRQDASVKSVAMDPKPLIRYQARVAKDSVHGENCRIYVPGTPYLAALVDSQFILVDLPQGVMPLRLIGSDGKVYPVPDSLNTADSGRLYRPATTPTGSIDTLRPGDSIPDFQILAPTPHDAYLEVTSYLEAKIVGISATDPRLSIIWRWLPEVGRLPDSLDPDPHTGTEPPPSAVLVSPTSLRTEVQFHGDGVYRFLVTAIVGQRSSSDTALVSVMHLPTSDTKVLHPRPADSLVLGRPFDIQWQMPGTGPYTLELSINNDTMWIPIALHYASPGNLQVYSWTPSPDLGTTDSARVRIKDETDTTRQAVMQNFFHLIR